MRRRQGLKMVARGPMVMHFINARYTGPANMPTLSIDERMQVVER